jgi:hypothetical protein
MNSTTRCVTMSDDGDRPEPKRAGMVDIETLGTDPGAAITQIGVVQFDGDGLGREAEINVDPTSCAEHGLGADVDTVVWWTQQDADARETVPDGVRLERALRRVRNCLRPTQTIWAKPPAFDCAILRTAFEQTDIGPVPWSHWERRCVRTLERESPHWPDYEQTGTNHDALDDARHQARCASEYLAAVETEREDD